MLVVSVEVGGKNRAGGAHRSDIELVGQPVCACSVEVVEVESVEKARKLSGCFVDFPVNFFGEVSLDGHDCAHTDYHQPDSDDDHRDTGDFVAQRGGVPPALESLVHRQGDYGVRRLDLGL